MAVGGVKRRASGTANRGQFLPCTTNGANPLRIFVETFTTRTTVNCAAVRVVTMVLVLEVSGRMFYRLCSRLQQ